MQMKRILLVIVGALVLGGAYFAWTLSRDTSDSNRVQIPSSLVNGELPARMSSGTASSSPQASSSRGEIRGTIATSSSLSEPYPGSVPPTHPTAKKLFGKWLDPADAKYSITFETNGSLYELYDGRVVTRGRWNVVDDLSKEPLAPKNSTLPPPYLKAEVPLLYYFSLIFEGNDKVAVTQLPAAEPQRWVRAK